MDIVVATFGEARWQELARHRAAPSAKEQGRVILSHGQSLSEARNAGLSEVRSELCIFLDADDELEPGYVDAMEQGTADLRAPRVRYVRHGRPRQCGFPKVAGHRHDCTADCLEAGNWLVIGTAARTELLRKVGGFRDEPIYEDWSLWLRCYRAGATVEAIREAVYRAHVRPLSRNRGANPRFKDEWHYKIAAAA